MYSYWLCACEYRNIQTNGGRLVEKRIEKHLNGAQKKKTKNI